MELVSARLPDLFSALLEDKDALHVVMHLLSAGGGGGLVPQTQLQPPGKMLLAVMMEFMVRAAQRREGGVYKEYVPPARVTSCWYLITSVSSPPLCAPTPTPASSCVICFQWTHAVPTHT